MLSEDGLDIEEIVIKTFGAPLPVRPKLPKNHRKWTEAQQELNDVYQEAKAEACFKISDCFGWG